MDESRPFIVYGWPADSAKPASIRRKHTLDEAIDEARQLAGSPEYRGAQVADDSRMCWAEFGPLWRATMEA